MLLARLLQAASDENLVKHEVGSVKVEYEVQLADVAKVPVENLDVVVDHVKRVQLVVVRVNSNDEVQARVPLVGDTQVLVLDEVAQPRRPRQDERSKLLHDFRAFLACVLAVEFAQAHLALPRHEQHEVNHRGGGIREHRVEECLLAAVFVHTENRRVRETEGGDG